MGSLSFLRAMARWLRPAGKGVLGSRQRDLLHRMQRDNRSAGFPFATSRMWRELSEKILNSVKTEGIVEIEKQLCNTLFSQSMPKNPRYYRYALWLMYKAVKQRDVLGLLDIVCRDSDYDNRMVFNFQGHKVSWDVLTAVDALYSISEICPGLFNGPVVVADLGAGWGKIGYVLCKANPLATYMVFDIPEVLLISSTYLPRKLPGYRVVSYETVASLTRIERQCFQEPGLWFAGSHHLPRVADGALDVFVNMSSFQEMTLAQVDAYFGLISAKVHGVCYLLEYWEHQGLADQYATIRGSDEYPFRNDWRQYYMRNATFSERYFEAAFEINPPKTQAAGHDK